MRSWDGLILVDEIEVYRWAGYKKRYGLGTRPALVIVDVEYNFKGLPIERCCHRSSAPGTVSGRWPGM